MSRDPLSQQVQRFKALGHPARLRIARMLGEGELCVCQMTAVLRLAPSTVSAHLSELRRAGLVQERKDGRWVFYALEDDGRRLLDDVGENLAADPQVREDARAVMVLRALGPEELCRVGVDAAGLLEAGKGRAAAAEEKRPGEEAR